MSDFKAKMYQIQFRGGLLLRGEEGREGGGDGKGRGRGREGGGEETRPHPFTPAQSIFMDTPLGIIPRTLHSYHDTKYRITFTFFSV